MESKTKILENIGVVFDKSLNNKLEDELFVTINEELEILAEYFKTTKQQAFLISLVLIIGRKSEKAVDLDGIIKHLQCGFVKMLPYTSDIEFLVENGYLSLKKARFHFDTYRDSYFVNVSLVKAIYKNEAIPVKLVPHHSNVYDVLEEIHENFPDTKATIEELREQLDKVFIKYKNFKLIATINELGLDPINKLIYTQLIWKALIGWDSLCVDDVIKLIDCSGTNRIVFIQNLITEKNLLLKGDWIETENSGLANDVSIRLTQKSITMIKKCGVILFQDSVKRENIITPKQISKCNLIFCDDEMKQLNVLQNLLIEKNLRKTQKCLKSKSLPKGITVILHGSPGTGKTETVKQLAKATNRHIMKVDISQTKSKWFGESEKIIKRIFSDYKILADEQKLLPILFFNEADAVISKRRDLDSSNVSQTQNSIQNVLLEELENFEGILIATSNLINNIDAAFERRFLFKIEFQKPSIEVKGKIWKIKLPHLSENECALLAETYDFSGGQIDNIVRKKEINEIISGNLVDLDRIFEFCEEETLTKKNNRKSTIGFKNNKNVESRIHNPLQLDYKKTA